MIIDNLISVISLSEIIFCLTYSDSLRFGTHKIPTRLRLDRFSDPRIVTGYSKGPN